MPFRGHHQKKYASLAIPAGMAFSSTLVSENTRLEGCKRATTANDRLSPVCVISHDLGVKRVSQKKSG